MAFRTRLKRKGGNRAGLVPHRVCNIANKEIDEAGKDEVRVFFVELTRAGMSGHAHTIVKSLFLRANPLFGQRTGIKEAILSSV